MMDDFNIETSEIIHEEIQEQTYFEYVLDIPQHEEKRFKVEVGRKIHERARKINPDYLRKKIGVKDKQSDVYLSGSMGIRGIVDEILFLDDGTTSPLDYKYAEYKEKIFKTYKLQLVFYAQLIKDNFNVPVTEVPIQQKDFNELEEIVKNLLDIIQRCRYPKPTRYKRRCQDCCYRNICEGTI